MGREMSEGAIDAVMRRMDVRVAAQGKSSALAAALVYEGYLKVELSQPGTGRMYGNHQASAPGEPPAPDTGALRASVHTEQERDGSARVVESGPAPAALEFGAPERGLAPRPHMRPALVKAKGAMQAAAAKADVREARIPTPLRILGPDGE